MNKEKILNCLNNILELELAGVVRYTHYAFMVQGPYRLSVVDWLREQAKESLIHARDEAHRFVNTFHRKHRKTSKMVDPLEKIPGLGAKKFQTLIRHFGGRKEVLHASEKDIKTVPGIGSALAKRIFESIND